MKRNEVREKLLDGTIKVIASEGLDKTSTKLISTVTGVNEVYIYRCFEDKEDLLAKTFASLDEELLLVCLKHVEIMCMRELEYEIRGRIFFNTVWKFILGNRDKCLTFIRYYYSTYFLKYSAEEHKERYLPLVEKFKVAFKEEANVWMIMNHILTTMLDFAVKVFNGALGDDDDTEEHVFRLVYVSIKQYFKERGSEANEKSLGRD